MNDVMNIDSSDYTREELQRLIIDFRYGPFQIAEHFGYNSEGNFRFPPEKIKEDLKNWGITTTFIWGHNIVEDILENIEELDKTISEYTKKSKAKYRDLTDLRILLEKGIGTKVLAESSPKLYELLLEILNDISLIDIVKIQQKDEDIRASYFKLKQEENKLLLRAIEVQEKAITGELMLASIYEELVRLDQINGTNMSLGFMDNVKQRIINKISADRLLTNKQLLKSRNKKKVKQKNHPNHKKYMSEIKDIEAEYDIHYQVAVHAKKIYVDSEQKLSMDECVNQAKQLCFNKYSYINENGQREANDV